MIHALSCHLVVVVWDLLQHLIGSYCAGLLGHSFSTFDNAFDAECVECAASDVEFRVHASNLSPAGLEEGTKIHQRTAVVDHIQFRPVFLASEVVHQAPVSWVNQGIRSMLSEDVVRNSTEICG